MQAKDTHEAIVTEEIYVQAQKVLKSCKRKKMPAKPNQRFRGLLKCAVCGRTLERVICKEPYFCCPTRKTVPDALCRRVHVDEQDLETALTASIQSRVKARLEAVITEIQNAQIQHGNYEAFLKAFEKLPDELTEFTPDAWNSLVDYATVYGESDIHFTFKNGQEIKA